ncbi:hypothetical protein [Micromonospora echinofusca]|uniref:hypothetical protein n=1 Tax=Micromonospora echinofusca TaxID=47858 RepID=UPI00371BCC70
MVSTDDDLRSHREAAIRKLAALPQSGDPLEFQLSLVEAHELATGTDDDDAKYHRRLLRIIADGLAWRLLGQHTVRCLSNHPGKPAAIKKDDPDFQFVLKVASAIRAEGAIPLICDLTNLLLVGDIIVVHRGGIEIVECKNSRDPQILERPGRLLRQRRRGHGAADYLSESVVRVGETGFKVAQDVNFPDPQYAAVSIAAEEADAAINGIGAVALGLKDYVVVIKSDSNPDLSAELIPDRPSFVEPIASMHSSFLRSPSWVAPPVTAYEIDPDLQIRLLELDMMMVRICDLAILNEAGVEGPAPFTLKKRRGRYFLDLGSKREGAELSDRFIDGVLFAPIPVLETRDALVRYVNSIPSEAWEGGDVSEDAARSVRGSVTPTNYVTAFRGETDEILLAMQATEQLLPEGSDLLPEQRQHGSDDGANAPTSTP